MEAMSVAEAIELIRMNESAMSTQFQIWLTITFSTIVAVFVGRNLLTRVMKWLVSTMYLLASITVIAQSVHLIGSNVRITEVLVKDGIRLNESALAIAGIAGYALFLIGMATTLYFIHMSPHDNIPT